MRSLTVPSGSFARFLHLSPSSNLSSRAKRGLCFSLAFCALTTLAAARTAQDQIARPKITGIAYVRVYVADLPAAREFYHTALGLSGDTLNCIGAGASCFSVNGSQSIGLAQVTGGTPDNLVAEIAFATPDVEKMRQ